MFGQWTTFFGQRRGMTSGGNMAIISLVFGFKVMVANSSLGFVICIVDNDDEYYWQLFYSPNYTKPDSCETVQLLVSRNYISRRHEMDC
jgi:hypothetical protein